MEPRSRFPDDLSQKEEGRRKKEEGRRKKEEGRREKGEGRRKKEEGRRKKGEGRRRKEEGRRKKEEREEREEREKKEEGEEREKGEVIKSRVSAIKKVLTALAVAIPNTAPTQDIPLILRTYFPPIYAKMISIKFDLSKKCFSEIFAAFTEKIEVLRIILYLKFSSSLMSRGRGRSPISAPTKISLNGFQYRHQGDREKVVNKCLWIEPEVRVSD
jgi:hypothetical protein